MPTEATAAGSTAVVTGAASGMGRAVVETFLASGWAVRALDRDESALAALPRRPQLACVAVDVTDRHAVGEALSGTGPLAAVVNAAGIYPPSTLADYDEALYRRIFDVNLLGTLNVVAAARGGLAAAGGAVVNFASIDAFAVSPGQLLYSASKAAVVSVTKTLALELADEGISVNAIAPGWVDTPGTRAGGRMAEAVRAVPAGRAATPGEIADWVLTLCTGSYLTGETLVVSGGLIVR